MAGTSARRMSPRRRRAWTVALAIAALMIAVAGCGSSSSSSSSSSAGASTGSSSASSGSASAKPPSKTIGYVDIVASGAQQKRWYHFFTTATNLLGWKVILDDANGVPATALTDLRNLVAQHVDAIVVSCVDTSVLHPALVAAKAAGIPTVALGCQNGPPPGDWSATYAENDPALAKFLAAYVIKYLKAKGITQASVLQDRTILVGRLRSDYFINALKAAGIKLISTPVIPETSIVPSTTTAVKSAVAADPNLGAIIPVFDFSAGPTVAALKSLNSTKVAVFSYYADLVNLPLMLQPNSPVKGLVDGPVEQVSLTAVDQLLKHFNTGAALDPNAANTLKVPYVVFTPKNHPAYSASYITPWNVNTYLAPFVTKWNAEYHYNLPVPSGK
jgi:ABC-type sugar transport system substrate-binding protein